MTKSRKLLLAAMLTFTPEVALGQVYVPSTTSWSFHVGADSVESPLSGGWNSGRPNAVDIDGDGLTDLLVTQSDGRVSFFKNIGDMGHARFLWVTNNYQYLNVGTWARWVDIDDDGDFDLLCSGTASTIRLFSNTGSTTQPVFEIQYTTLSDSSGNAILSEFASIPAFVDIDSDGDLDFFTGRSSGSLAFYENIGSSQSYSFRFVTDHFEDILIISGGKRSQVRHGASAISFEDIDGDGDVDLLWGDVFAFRLFYLENTGTAQSPDFPAVTSSTFPDAAFHTTGFNVTEFFDEDGDGDEDLLISSLNPSEEEPGLFFFRNNRIPGGKPFMRTSGAPQFSLVTDDYLREVDFGSYSVPAFAHLNGDTLIDLVMGMREGSVRFFNGSPSDSRAFVEDTLLTVPSAGNNHSIPCPIDFDHDGDIDLLVGYFNGQLRYYENVGSTANPEFLESDLQLTAIDVGNHAAPTAVDLDADNDLDLIVGSEAGDLSVFFNSGSAAEPIWTHAMTVNGRTTFSVPTAVYWNADSLADLLIGYYDGTLDILINRGKDTRPDYAHSPLGFTSLKQTGYASWRPLDFDGDDDWDLVAGNARGGLELFEATSSPPVVLRVDKTNAVADSVFTGWVVYTGLPIPKFELVSAPAGMTMDEMTGTLRWIPRKDQSGPHNVVVKAFSPEGVILHEFEIIVDGGHEAGQSPTLTTFPNPFSTISSIRYHVFEPAFIRLFVVNSAGQKVKALYSGRADPGSYTVEWSGTDEKNSRVANGVYFVVLRSSGGLIVRKIIFLR